MDPNATANAHFAPARAPVVGRTATVSSESLRVFALGAEARGLDPGPIFAASGIDPTILGRRGARVGGGSVADAWTRACERFGDPLFPLTIGDALPMGAVAPLDYLVLSSADVGTALGHVTRYAPILSDTEILTVSMQGNEAHYRCQNRNKVPYHIEMIIGVFARRTRELFGPNWSIARFCFTHSALGPRATYDRICQAPVFFEMPFNEVVFARDLTEMPMPGADARLNAILVGDAEAALAAVGRPTNTPSFMDTVKRVLEDGLHERDLTLNRLADRLGVSTRTLQRRLRAAGVTHRGLVRGVRQDVADRSLATRASQGQIARTLGYSGAGAFQRAFKRWAGVTPGQRRRPPNGSR
jgi:AraC-like DNA-binding protein